MKTLKHIGRLKGTGTKVLVVFRVLPGETHQALVISANALHDSYHDALMKLVESDQAQDAYEFGEIMFTRHFPDGRPMLTALQQDGALVKVPTDSVIMTPTINDSIQLDQLNLLIAEQKNCAVDELPNFVSGAKGSKSEVKEVATAEDITEIPATPTSNEPLSDKDIARSYRSQADALYKEAAKLRKQADDLDPPQKKAATKVKESEGA